MLCFIAIRVSQCPNCSLLLVWCWGRNNSPFTSIYSQWTLQVLHLCSFYPSLECGEQPSLLLLGDEKGGVHLLWFLKPSRGLFKSPSKKENLPQRIFFPVCPASFPWWRHRHAEPVIVVSVAATGPGPAQWHGLLPSHPQHPPGANQQSDVRASSQRGHDIIRESRRLCHLYKSNPKAGPLYLAN